MTVVMLAFPSPSSPVARKSSIGIVVTLLVLDRHGTMGTIPLRLSTEWMGCQVVFEEPTWKETWEPMMRADFNLFDQCPG